MPFTYFASGLNLQKNGVPVTGVSVLNLVNGNVALNGGVASFTAPSVSITDGTNTISPLNLLKVENLNLSGTLALPTIVQIVTGQDQNIVQFPNLPTPGNLILIMTTRGMENQPSPYGIIAQGANWSGAYGGYNAAIQGGIFEGNLNPTFNVQGSNFTIVEIAGSGGIGNSSSLSNVNAGSFTVNGNAVAFSGPVGDATLDGLCFWIYGDENSHSYDVNSVLPNGSDYIATMEYDAYSYSFTSPVAANSTPQFGLSLGGVPNPGGYAGVVIKSALAGGSATINPS
jgi:hypothetical protein